MRYCHSSSFANRGWTRPFLLLVALCMLAAWPALAQSADSVALSGHTPKEVAEGSATLVGHYNPSQMLRLVIGIQPPHMAEEKQFLNELKTKGSPEYRHFLTSDEWDARFAPSVEDEQAVVDWAKASGFTVTERYSHRLIVDLEAPSATIEKALGVSFELPQNERGNFRWGERLFSQLDAQDLAGLQVFRQVKWKQLELFADVFDAAAHEALDGIDGALWSLDQILARRVADDDLIATIQRDDRRDEIQPVLARDHDRAFPLHESHERIRGSEINSDDAVRWHLLRLCLQAQQLALGN